MRTPLVIGVVLAAHVLFVGGGMVVVQGCRSFRGMGGGPEPVMPPRIEPAPAAPVAPPAAWSPSVTRTTLPEPMPSETTTYVVARGDCLSTIASRFGLRVKTIMALNGITDPNKIRAGQRLLLPGRHDTGAPVAPRVVRVQPVATDGNVYTVVSGDSLSVIAARFDTTVGKLKEANGLSGTMIRVGQKLVIPGESVARAADPVPDFRASAMRETTDVENTVRVTTEPDPEPDPEPLSFAEPDVVAPVDAGSSVAPGAGGTGDQPRAVRTHVVDEEEDLYSVAMLWGVSVAEIMELNGLSDPEVQVGQQLKIPMAQ